MALNDIIVPKEAVVGVLSEVVLTPAEIGASASEPADDIFRVVGSADPTKKVAFEVDGLTTATTRTLTAPDASGTIARTEDFAAPPAIGSTTPNTAAFTTLTASSLVASGNVVSDSNLRMRSNTGQISLGAANDVQLFRGNTASVLELRSGTSPQTFRIYNTYTDASNYERGFMRWDSNNFDIGCEAAGTGTLRNVRIKTDATSGVSGTGYIEFGGSATINTIKSVGGTANGALYIYSQGTLRMLIGGSSGTRFHQTIYPNANQAIDIGLTNLRWRDVFCRSVNLTGDLILTTATGTKIGTATTQKLGFFNATPVVQQAAIADATDAASTRRLRNSTTFSPPCEPSASSPPNLMLLPNQTPITTEAVAAKVYDKLHLYSASPPSSRQAMMETAVAAAASPWSCCPPPQTANSPVATNVQRVSPARFIPR
jgi:hypothetical protein